MPMTSFDRAQQAHDANTEPPEPRPCAPDEHEVDNFEVSDETTIDVTCKNCESTATFLISRAWEL